MSYIDAHYHDIQLVCSYSLPNMFFEMFPKKHNLHMVKISIAVMFDGVQVSHLDSYAPHVPA
jgi:hypothetical protein